MTSTASSASSASFASSASTSIMSSLSSFLSASTASTASSASTSIMSSSSSFLSVASSILFNRECFHIVHLLKLQLKIYDACIRNLSHRFFTLAFVCDDVNGIQMPRLFVRYMSYFPSGCSSCQIRSIQTPSFLRLPASNSYLGFLFLFACFILNLNLKNLSHGPPPNPSVTKISTKWRPLVISGSIYAYGNMEEGSPKSSTNGSGVAAAIS